MDQELFISSFRGLSTRNCHQKPDYTSLNQRELSSKENESSAFAFLSGPEYIDRKSCEKVRSGFAEYTLNEDGYMNIQDLVDFLKRENAMDICVIRTTGDKRNYVDYFVVVSGVSTRHLRAMAKNLEQLVGVNHHFFIPEIQVILDSLLSRLRKLNYLLYHMLGCCSTGKQKHRQCVQIK